MSRRRRVTYDGTKCHEHLDELDDIQAALAALDLGDEALGLADAPRELDLGQPRVLAGSLQQRDERAMGGRSQGLGHRRPRAGGRGYDPGSGLYQFGIFPLDCAPRPSRNRPTRTRGLPTMSSAEPNPHDPTHPLPADADERLAPARDGPIGTGQTGMAGEHFVTGELLRRGWLATMVHGNSP